MSEVPLNPYAAPEQQSSSPSELGVQGVKVDDPTVLARWTIGLLIFVTAYDLLIHAILTFDLGGQFGFLIAMAWPEVISSVLLIAYSVIFLCWMYRVMWNSKRVDPANAKISPGYGVGSYFIPILNFWVPCQALMQASRSTLGEDRAVLIWWLSTMVVVLMTIIFLFLPSPEMIQVTEKMKDGTVPISAVTWFEHFIAVTDVIITFLEVVMILSLTRRQREWSMGGVASPA